jgi:ABC-type dipeptide/oligopeptide/nickel transport system permease component
MAKKVNKTEQDSVYFLKLVLYFLLGCLWIKIGGQDGLVVPVGLIIGLIFASHDHFKIDRKIEIAMLLIATMLSYVLPIGFVLSIG